MKSMPTSKAVVSRFRLIASLIGSGLAVQCYQTAYAEDFLVKTQAQYLEVSDSLKPGDKVLLANGVWNDFEILFHGKGTEEQPISLVAQEKGKVFIAGQSNLRLHGEHLFVSGLVFKNGYTPTSAVISFRSDKDNFANNSRVSEIVIDNFNNPERFDGDYWVAMYGKNNRFDHNHLEGKRNQGVTMAVRLDSEESRENNHRIDHNYFGPRPILGSNGGESLRIGTSHHSLTNSRTVVENNYFDRCDGELEIISNKAGSNVIRGNVFFESRGTLTLRHGNDTLVENNVFFGNGVDHTGGIRVINKRQTIRNNYMEGLAGYRFGGALVVMNGVPNSSINRYHQVEDSLITNNSLINSSHIQLAAGSDQERSAVPIRTEFSNNLIFNDDSKDVFTVYDDIAGITFSNNLASGVEEPKISKGFSNAVLTVTRADNGLVYPVTDGADDVGVSRDLMPIKKQQTGVSWYPKPEKDAVFGGGSTVEVKPGQGALGEAIRSAKAGDIINLSAGEYIEPKLIVIDKPLLIRGADYGSKAYREGSVKLYFEKTALFELQDGGSLSLQGLTISGALSPDSAGNSVIRTQRRSMLSNYQLLVEQVRVSDLDVNHSFNFLTPSKASFADRIEIIDSSFSNVTGAILALDKETDDYGIYNAEYVTISGSSFDNVEGDLVDFYRGGTDESTFGPHFDLSNSSLNNVGAGKRNKSKSSILLHGVQVSNVHDNKIVGSPNITVKHTVGEPVTKIVNNRFIDTPEITVTELNSDKKNTAIISDNSYTTEQK
ncbi:polysaccharide lyase 6 family protein [Arenicella xantha]|uniref:Poly(Beta-D-mannuronate) lyase n=1 Tax=Arenicella xantha TaxID=644221 RepID=A0A395JIW8_9GAMM|nr:polysaccharide lyase 6 family protein [Arenicella xantha]RBP49719.1 poly(beta-D-mannuronate) lyase [Arenicella xantha]